MEIEIDRIKAEPINPPIQPEAAHIQKRILNIWVMQVQIWLLDKEIVQVILHPLGRPFPRTAAEN